MYVKVLGIRPLSSKLYVPPVIVNVFPEPVWPYAKMVPLYPYIAESTTSFATLSNIFYCFASISNTWLKANTLFYYLLLIYPSYALFGT